VFLRLRSLLTQALAWLTSHPADWPCEDSVEGLLVERSLKSTNTMVLDISSTDNISNTYVQQEQPPICQAGLILFKHQLACHDHVFDSQRPDHRLPRAQALGYFDPSPSSSITGIL
jgi:hypothetical protein